MISASNAQSNMEQNRRASTTSESSVEPMDLGRTPKKIVTKESRVLSSTFISSLSNDSENYESDNDDYTNNRINYERHVEIEPNDNPHSLRKKFRISTPNKNNNNINKNNNNNNNNMTLPKTNETTQSSGDRTNNESGFVDISSHHVNSSPESAGEREREDVKYICPICEVVSATPHEFTNHIRCHNYSSGDSENFTCRICMKVLSSASSLDRHVLVHTGERPFNCKYCHLTFTTNGNMHRHMRTHKQHQQQHNNSGGGGGGGAGSNNSNSDPHSGSSGGGGDGESYESDGCSTDSNGSSSNNNNRNNNNYKRKSTEDETGIIKRRMKTINNNIINENESEPQIDQKYCCPVCNRTDFISMLSLGTHMDREHPGIPAKCRQCETIFKTHKALNAHRCANKLNITQGFKDITFVDFSSDKFPLIAKSLCEQSIRTPVSSQKFECSKCYRAFPCASAVEIHIKDCGECPQDFSLRKRASSESSDEENRRDEFFAHLDLQNKSATSLASSMSSPRNSEKSSDLKVDLEKSPQSYKHQETKDLADIQSILNITSSSSSYIRSFDNCVNTPSSDYGYGKDEEEAQDAFTAEFRKMKLRGEFPCKLCPAVFPNLRALKGHNRIHLSAAGAGPYRCNMCPYSILDKAALIRHMRTHNGDRPYECAVCNYAFTTKANCERHLRNRHAKTTREEVKRAIIYHPSEDSSCEDPIKKIHLFSSPEFDQDDEHAIPKDRSTPVSHLKEMLLPEKPVKIQVKSLEKLIDRSIKNYEDQEKVPIEPENNTDSNRPIDLSMDVLDLSKKSKYAPPAEEKVQSDFIAEQPKVNIAMLEKNNQILLAQQQLLNEALPKIDPSHYLQFTQFYRNLVFNPFFLQNSLLPNSVNDLSKFAPNMLMNSIFPGNGDHRPSPPNPIATSGLCQGSGQCQPLSQSQQIQNNIIDNSMIKSGPPNPVVLQQSLTPQSPQITIPRHHLAQPAPQQPSMVPPNQGSGPVKMVIKNGVLMPKQKQRRYRTERPFACEHCSARFTLRSNMERHIKQQHPQFWAQRQRGGHHIVRRGSNSASMSQISSGTLPASVPTISTAHFSAISDQVKYAILAQQLKAKKDSDILQQALAQGSNGAQSNNPNYNSTNTINSSISTSMEDDDPKLVIDEAEDHDNEETHDDVKPEDLSRSNDTNQENVLAKKMANSILEQAFRSGSNSVKQAANVESGPMKDPESKDFGMKIANTMIARAESVGKYLKEVASSPFKDESSDLVSVSKLVDNATNSVSFNNYFRPSDLPNQLEQSDEEGLVASGSASESNNSGAEETQSIVGQDQKKKSAYSLAPNRVSCPYCQRMFPWSSSLRRHILTHTGQKPFKCSHCPLLFTTKSNCDRHLLRKHGNVESAVSLYVPIEDIPEPVRTPKSMEETDPPLPPNPVNVNLTVPNVKPEPMISSSDLPFKCHLCDSSFAERIRCLDHIKLHHAQEFALLIAKGAIDADADYNQTQMADDDEKNDGRGKYPDYANRKVICAFCVRRFWSTEDLRRHMRTHSGERPFQCDICLRKFTLKHSMLRHMKKHSGSHQNSQLNATNSGSDLSDDEQPSSIVLSNSLRSHKIQEILSKAEVWKKANLSNDQKENISLHSFVKSEGHGEENNSDLIGNLLGISDQGILNKLLSSPDEAAKLLGIDK